MNKPRKKLTTMEKVRKIRREKDSPVEEEAHVMSEEAEMQPQASGSAEVVAALDRLTSVMVEVRKSLRGISRSSARIADAMEDIYNLLAIDGDPPAAETGPAEVTDLEEDVELKGSELGELRAETDTIMVEALRKELEVKKREKKGDEDVDMD